MRFEWTSWMRKPTRFRSWFPHPTADAETICVFASAKLQMVWFVQRTICPHHLGWQRPYPNKHRVFSATFKAFVVVCKRRMCGPQLDMRCSLLISASQL